MRGSRAIESRRYVVRSANGDISMINPKGDFIRQMPSNTDGSFVEKISFLSDKTFMSSMEIF